METDITAKKAEIRKELLKNRSEINEVEAYKKSRKICEGIIDTSAFKNAECIYAYMPVNGEVYILPVVEAGFSLGKRIALPRCLDKNGHMEFFEITSFEDLTPGSFNIPEPKQECHKTDVKNGIMLVPGVGFDTQKNRLGYSRGYYDRFIGGEKSVLYIAPAYEMQLLESIPAEPHDKRVDMIVTEKKVI